MATTNRNVVVGVFQDRQQAQHAVQELRRVGFPEADIGVAARDTGTSATGTASTSDQGSAAGTGAAVGAVAGAGTGALWALGIAAGMLPAIGPIIAGGILASVLASAAGGAIAGGIAGALIGLGVPEDEANYYDEEFKAGRTIVTVKANGRYDEATNLLRRLGAYDVKTPRTTQAGTTGQTHAQGATATGSQPHYAQPAATTAGGQQHTGQQHFAQSAATASNAGAFATTPEDAYWRQNFQSRPYAGQASSYDQYRPAYPYGWESWRQHRGKRFDEVESDLRSGWEKNRSQSGLTWEKAKDAVRDAWEHLTGGTTSTQTATPRTTERTDGEQTMQLREEELHVHKQPVETGEARVHKEVVTEQRTINVPVEREEVVVERRPATGKTPAGSDIGQSEEIRIPVMEEQVQVEKQPVVKEEVTVGKRRVQDTQHVEGTVRKEEVRIDEEGDVDVNNANPPTKKPTKKNPGTERRS